MLMDEKMNSKCILCKIRGELLYQVGDMRINKCPNCGLVYTKHNEIFQDNIYREDYFTGKGMSGKDFLKNKEILEFDRFRLKKRLKKIEQLVSKGNLLDVGCATGIFLEMTHNKGWNCYGIELSEFAANYCRNKLKLNVVTGTLDKASYPKNYFDVVTLFHVLEHIADPVTFLSNDVRPVLKSGGLLVIETPNFACWESKSNREQWSDLKPREHIYYFTPLTLKKVIEKSGFEIVQIQTRTDVCVYRKLRTNLQFIGFKFNFRIIIKGLEVCESLFSRIKFLNSSTILMLSIFARFLELFGLGKYLIIYARKVQTSNTRYIENLSFIRKYRSKFKNLENIDCPLCQMNNFEHLFSIEYLNFVRCNTCGLVYINPHPAIGDLLKVYSPGLKEWTRVETYIDKKIDLFKNYLTKVEAVKEKGKILDIGCGIGLFLKIAREKGWDTYGVDVSCKDIEYAKRNYNLNVFKGTIEDANYPNDFFDVITMWDFIEHITDPLSCLKEVRRILKNDGMLFILTGNIESKEAREKGVYWPFLGGSTHLVFYSPQTIRKILDIVGLKVIKLSSPKKSRVFTAKVVMNFIRSPKKILGLMKNDLLVRNRKPKIGSSMLVMAKKR